MRNEQHIIHRVNLEIEAPDVKSAKALQDEATRLFYHEILPKLERWLDELLPGKETIRLERLDLHVHALDLCGFAAGFSELALSSFREKIEPLTSSSPLQPVDETGPARAFISQEEKVFELFLSFLETGRRPWWSEPTAHLLQEEHILELPILSHPEWIERLFGLFRSQETAVERLVKQFSRKFVTTLIQLLLEGRLKLQPSERARLFAGGSTQEPNEGARLLDYFLKQFSVDEQPSLLSAARLQNDFLRRIIIQLAATSTPLEWKSFQQLTLELIPETQKKQEEQTLPLKGRGTPASEKNPGEKKIHEGEEEGVYVDHAGLVLLHPFLDSFFREFDLLQDGSFKNEGSRNIAMHLLSFLATGEEFPLEHQLTFEKFLCGAELAEPVERFVTLGHSMKEECETLLQAAIGHWHALKKTSPDGLREGFLQRSGKLVLSEFQNRLVVENKSHDVLLTFLPWGYGIIKLPWLEAPLFVEWFA